MIAWLLAGLVVVSLTALLLVRRTWLRVEIVGPSMSPTFESGDRVLARRVDPGRLRTGDVVVIEGPAAATELAAAMLNRSRYYEVVERGSVVLPSEGGTTQKVIKRVAAMPGERLPFAVPGHPEGSVVPDGRLAVAGDNPDQSNDSRHYGYVSVRHVLGRVKLNSQPS
ncbi:S26 family signal peptidase [Kribbella sp. NBC_01245]|uniref:S26 family signal peptidase n=1 Tax=Kribbella sp. NBC_01245 TaxID=2903578 RepID=UPI002E28A19D|nr:S26 family signal peptidase [Kribbella sp. NBC_01245]